MRISFPHGTWWLEFKKKTAVCMSGIRGSCDEMTKRGRKRIYVKEGMPPKEELEVTIHELCHAAFPGQSEEYVQAAGEQISNALWTLGWRKLRA